MTHQQPLWGYEDDEEIGPNEWANYYQTGKLQSPINILVDFCALNNAVTHCNLTSDCRHNKHLEGGHCCCTTSTHDRQCLAKLASTSLAANLRRTHLDSIGEDNHQRSSSTSSSQSSSSSARSSPSENSYGCDDEDDYHLKSTTTTTTTTTCIREQQKFNSNGRTKCVDCIPSSQTTASLIKGRLPLEQNTRYCVSNKKLFLGYPRYMSSIQLCNTGHSWQINISPELAANTLLSGPPLADREYRLAQVHAHWGEDSGSEHQINGKSYAAEIHFVHWNCTNFKSFEEASKQKHGLAVLGVLVMALEGQQNKNKHLEKIASALKHIKEAHSSTDVRTKLDLKKLFPANRWSYASYEGSLTTPPLSEVVDWIVFLNPITCSINQIQQFQEIYCESSKTKSNPMKRNCRPVQPTDNRLVSIWAQPMAH